MSSSSQRGTKGGRSPKIISAGGGVQDEKRGGESQFELRRFFLQTKKARDRIGYHRT